MITVYGLKNCDTCRNALKWLEAEGLAHQFHDLRKDGVDEVTIQRWSDAVGWEMLLNKRGTTWRGLEDAVKEGANEANAASLMAEHPALIKRPVFVTGEDVIVGFKDEQKNRLTGQE
ncbi:MAG: ArsC family reductase [Rhodospirillales bacterium]|nr:ArsC family reductase [Alphaproteobacteria bacterium]MBL6947512.1 ArsC family reductase [Rhodospirillales bacterium]